MKTQRKRFFQKPNRNAKAKKAGGGFTIIELLIVIVIVSIVAAIAVPSIAAFIRHGQQVNRMNIARTIYLAAQGELTAMRLDRTLADFDENDILQHFTLRDSVILPSEGSDDNDDNGNNNNPERPFIHYITTAPPTAPGAPDTRPLVERLLRNTVLDRIIIDDALNPARDGAIVIEFNIETGVVLSVFYSDIVRQLRYEEDETIPPREENISGIRPYTAYSARRQGYFGVSSTGNLPYMPIEEVARIFDGARLALYDGENHRVNVMYAEFLIADPTNGTHTFELFNTSTVFTTGAMNLNPAATFNPPIPADEDPIRQSDSVLTPIGATGVYHDPTPTADGLHRFIWIIDYIGSDHFATQHHSVIGKRDDFIGGNMHTVRARVIGPNGEIARSPMSAHTDFAREMPDSTGDRGSFEIRSARHLYNIRFNLENARYTQTTDIDMRYGNNNDEINEVTNFRPIEIQTSPLAETPVITTPFNGEFIAMRGIDDASTQFIIQNLSIDTSEITPAANRPNDVGLFGQLGSNAFIQGVALFNAQINAPNAINAGAIAGQLQGGRITQSWSYANITGGDSTAGSSSTGGLVGTIGIGGRLDHSFNAGFFDHRSNDTLGIGTPSISPGNVGFVNARRGNVGGLVGTNNGTILGSFNNARVNLANVNYIEGVSQEPVTRFNHAHPANDDINPPGGIAGINTATGTISNSYATNLIGWVEGNRGFGIAAAGGTGARFINNFFIGNGTPGIEQTRVPNATLANESPTVHGLPTSIFVSNDIPHVPGENRYFEDGEHLYPYPIIASNNPFAHIYELLGPAAWGWEDVLGVTGASGIIYYELYDDETWGFQYGSRQAQDELEEWVFNRPTYKVVVNDGYSIELDRVPGGYTVVIEGHPHDRVFRIPYTPAPTPWIVVADVEEGFSWLDAYPIPSDSELGIDNSGWWRFFIPNALLEYAWSELERNQGGNPTVTIRVYNGLSPEFGDDSHLALDEPAEINPLFAPQDDGLIRSPRHIRNIGRTAALRGAPYTQALNIDFRNYRTALAPGPIPANASILPIVNAAVEGGAFTGTFNGDRKWISNLTIPNAQNADTIGVGLFSINNGTIRNVTMRDDNTDLFGASIIGQSNVGAIAGINNHIIENVSVQQIVEAVDPNPDYIERNERRRRRPIVSGTSNVGGIVGTNNSGARLSNAVVISTSAGAVARGPNASTGGMIGLNNGTANNLMFLAVSPGETDGTFLTGPFRQFVGSGNDGSGVYLAGNVPIIPFYTYPSPAPPSSYAETRLLNYNYRTNLPNYSGNTAVTATRSWDGWINPGGTAGNLSGPSPYYFPPGTVAPREGHWPQVDTFDITLNDGLVYFERYHDGEYRIFTRRRDPSSPTGFRDVNLLRPDGIIVEAGYAANVPYAEVGTGATRSWFFSFTRGGPTRTDWGQGSPRFNFTTIHRVPVLGQDDIFLYKIPMQGLINAATIGDPGRHILNPDRSQPFLVNLPFAGSGNEWDYTYFEGGIRQGAVFYINPFFAKAIYPVEYHGEEDYSRLPEIPRQTMHSIRTPWHLQQISRVIGAGETPARQNQSAGHTFVLEGNLNFATIAATETWNGTTPVVINTGTTNPTSNLVRGELLGTLRGGVLDSLVAGYFLRSEIRTISNLNLTHTTANNKGLLNAIGIGGTVRDLVITGATIQNANQNGIVASSNSGTISNIAIRDSEITDTAAGVADGVAGVARLNTGTISNIIVSNVVVRGAAVNAGGIAANNSGTISNVFISGSQITTDGRAGGIAAVNTGTIENAVFLSNAAITPISGTQYSGGIAASNDTGTINSVLYIARAPGSSSAIYPITGSAVGTVINSFYLSGTHSIIAADNVVNEDLTNIENNFDFNTGTPPLESGLPATTHELNLMAYSFVSSSATWVREAIATDILQRNTYPYHFLTNNRPVAGTFPIATNQAIRIVYFEDYADDTRGYLIGIQGDNVISTLDSDPDVTIIRTGYGVIVSPPHGEHTLHTVRVGEIRAVIGRDSIRPLPNSTMYYFEIPDTLISGNDSGIRVIVNDIRLREDEVFYRNFAGAIFARGATPSEFIIRTPEQMLAINTFRGSNFSLESNLDFISRPLSAAAVTGTFTGTFNGNGHMISNLQIHTGTDAPDAIIGLFGTIGANGTVGNFTLDFGDSSEYNISYNIHAEGQRARAGAVAGVNNGTIHNIAIISANIYGHSPITADGAEAIAGGVAAINGETGTITNILYIAQAPGTGTHIFPIVRQNDNDYDYSIVRAFYLQGERIVRIPNDAELGSFNTLDVYPHPQHGNIAAFGETSLTAAQLDGTLWFAPIAAGYPYPSLRGSRTPIHPEAWPEWRDPSASLVAELQLDEQCECGEDYCEYCEYCENCKYPGYCEHCQETKPPDCENEQCEPGDCTCEPSDNNDDDETENTPPEDPAKPEYPYDSENEQDPIKPEKEFDLDDLDELISLKNAKDTEE